MPRESAPSRLRIFISAGPDLETEREVVGKAIASLPVSIGWIIKYTPVRGRRSDPAMEEVAACHFHALLLGADITAPVGSEFYIARQVAKRTLACLKEVPRTPAASVFVKQAPVEWKRFDGEDELRPLLQRAVVDQILERPEAYGVSVADWEKLSALSVQLGEEALEQDKKEVAPRQGGAGGDAVIVAPGRDLPSDGVLIEGPRDSH